MAKAKVTHRNKLEVVANPKVDFGLTPMQEKFCKIYATEEVTQTEAAIQAGYAKSNAHAIASKMLNGSDYPLILDRIHQLKLELQHKFEVTFESHVRKLSQIRDDAMANQNYASAVAAEKATARTVSAEVTPRRSKMGVVKRKNFNKRKNIRWRLYIVVSMIYFVLCVSFKWPTRPSTNKNVYAV